jgi:hypothetical protein
LCIDGPDKDALVVEFERRPEIGPKIRAYLLIILIMTPKSMAFAVNPTSSGEVTNVVDC